MIAYAKSATHNVLGDIMKKHLKNVYQEICDYENLYNAYLKARKNKRYRSDVLKFSSNLEEELFDIQRELLNHTYRVGRYREFHVYEPKKRLIMALPFRDRVVQWAVYQVLNPEFEKGYITDSYACIPGRGTHSAVKRLHYWLQHVSRKSEKYYYLKLDISKYFYRVDHQVLIEILEKKIKDPELMWLLITIIKSDGMKFGMSLELNESGERERLLDKGMPIGNLTSQMFANIYMNQLDQYAKRTLRIRHYIRYMDDVVILCSDKKQLHEYRRLIELFLEENLKLNLNNKTVVRPITLGIEFVGYRLWATHVKLRKSTALKMKRRFKQVQQLYADGEIEFDKVNSTVQSYYGVLKHCDSYNLRSKVFEDFVLKKNNQNVEDCEE